MPRILIGNNITLSSNQVVIIALAVIFIVFLITSAVLLYHWSRYGIHKSTTAIVTIVYFVVSAILLFTIIKAGITITQL